MLSIPHQNCVRGTCQQIAAAMLHCDDCHSFKWHTTVTYVFWDVQVTSNSDICLLGCASDIQQWCMSSGMYMWHPTVTYVFWDVQVTSKSAVCLLGCASDIQQWCMSSGMFKWHPTVTCVFWDTMLHCHWVSPDSFKESRIPLLGRLKPWQWRHYIPLKHQETLTQSNVLSQKTWILNSTAVRTQTSQGTSLLYTNTANKGFMKCGSWKFVAQICRTL